MQEEARSARSVKSAERVLDLLETIGAAPDGIGFAALGTRLGIPKSSLHALIQVLVGRGYIEAEPANRRFVLGLRAWETGFAYRRHHGFLKEARAVMEAIVGRVNETVQLAKLAGRENIYLDKADSTHALRLQSEVGMRLPAHATGIGKALLAELEPAAVRALYPEPALATYTPTTLGSVEALVAALALTRTHGFAVDNEEYTPGIFCLAVPVYGVEGRATTAMSVSVPAQRVTTAALPEILAALASGSLEITQRVGGRCPNAGLRALTDPQVAAARIEEMRAARLPVPDPA
jgi:IclR family acetate operon transcriptional repressor